jgi:hypothetical protein
VRPGFVILSLLPGILLLPVMFGLGSLIAVRINTIKPLPVTSTSDSRDARWQADIDFLILNLPRLHIDPFYVISEDDWREEALALRERVPTLSDEAVASGINRLMGMLGDGHTGLVLTGLFDEERVLYYPLRLTRFDDGFFVTAAFLEAQPAFGGQLLTINGTDVDEVITRLEPGFSYDAGNPYGLYVEAERELTWAFGLYAEGISDTLEQADYTFRTPDGDTLTLTLQSRPRDYYATLEGDALTRYAGTLPLYLQASRSGHNTYLQALPEHNALYLYYGSSQTGDLEFLTTTARALRMARRDNIARLIVDVRDNRGGNDVFSLLFSLRLRFHPLAQRGEIYVISGHHTFSAGFSVVAQLVNRANATSVGGIPGTRPNYFGNVRVFTLPYSGFTVFRPTTHTEKFSALQGATLYQPERLVAFTSADFLAGRDPYLSAILGE